jgi:hypothetical protein
MAALVHTEFITAIRHLQTFKPLPQCVKADRLQM